MTNSPAPHLEKLPDFLFGWKEIITGCGQGLHVEGGVWAAPGMSLGSSEDTPEDTRGARPAPERSVFMAGLEA